MTSPEDCIIVITVILAEFSAESNIPKKGTVHLWERLEKTSLKFRGGFPGITVKKLPGDQMKEWIQGYRKGLFDLETSAYRT